MIVLYSKRFNEIPSEWNSVLKRTKTLKLLFQCQQGIERRATKLKKALKNQSLEVFRRELKFLHLLREQRVLMLPDCED